MKDVLDSDSTFTVQCLRCETVTATHYTDALLSCPNCGSVELHVIEHAIETEN